MPAITVRNVHHLPGAIVAFALKLLPWWVWTLGAASAIGSWAAIHWLFEVYAKG